MTKNDFFNLIRNMKNRTEIHLHSEDWMYSIARIDAFEDIDMYVYGYGSVMSALDTFELNYDEIAQIILNDFENNNLIEERLQLKDFSFEKENQQKWGIK